MQRSLAITIAGLVGLIPQAQAQSTLDRERTAAYVASFQNPDGGFGGKPGSSLQPGLHLVERSGPWALSAGSIRGRSRSCIAYRQVLL